MEAPYLFQIIPLSTEKKQTRADRISSSFFGAISSSTVLDLDFHLLVLSHLMCSQCQMPPGFALNTFDKENIIQNTLLAAVSGNNP